MSKKKGMNSEKAVAFLPFPWWLLTELFQRLKAAGILLQVRLPRLGTFGGAWYQKHLPNPLMELQYGINCWVATSRAVDHVLVVGWRCNVEGNGSSK